MSLFLNIVCRRFETQPKESLRLLSLTLCEVHIPQEKRIKFAGAITNDFWPNFNRLTNWQDRENLVKEEINRVGL